MPNQRFSYLFEQYFAKEASEIEIAEFMALIHSGNFELQLEELIDQHYAKFLPQQNPLSLIQEDRILKAILLSRPELKITKTYNLKKIRTVLAIAASIIICLGIGFYLFNQHQYKDEQNLAANLIGPGSNKARLVLGNGKVILLDTLKNGMQDLEEGVKITKTKDGQLIYNINSSNNGNVDRMNMIETPKGGQYQISLSDGTKVWLNAASSLKYSNILKGDKREVILIGEAYFEVAKRPKQPFIVHTANQTVEVLGTHFNINAYPDEEIQVATLLEGSVRTSNKGHELLLKPGQQSVLNLKSNLFSMTNADTETVMAWKNGEFIFKDEDLASVMRKVARWYDVEVTFQGIDPESIKLGGWVSRKKNIAAVIKIIEPIAGVQIKIEGRRVAVTK
jgi:transmembrane sensor